MGVGVGVGVGVSVCGCVDVNLEDRGREVKRRRGREGANSDNISGRNGRKIERK